VIVATTTQKVTGGKNVWHVRNEQGERFGPVDFETLKSWARDGRLAPTNEVSENGTDWKLATSQRGLEMDWVAEVTPGTFYGPIHQVAMEELSKEGSLTGQAAFFVRSGFGAFREQELRAQREAQERLELSARIDEAQAKSADLERQLLRLREQVAASEKELNQSRRDQARASEALAKIQAEREAQKAASDGQSQRFEAERQTLQAAVRRAEASVAEGAGRIAELEGALAGAERAAGLREAAAKQVLTLSAGLEAAKAELEEARQAACQARVKGEAAAEAQEAVKRALESEARQTEALKKELAMARAKLEEARRRGETARALARQALDALDVPGEPPVVATVEAEPLERERKPPVRPPREDKPLEVEVLPPERAEPVSGKPPVVNHANRAKPGLSLAELEHQARRELERLGAQGKTFFAKKK